MNVSCPISAERINENVVRTIAFLVALIAIACLVYSNYWAMLFLLYDFTIRAFSSGKLSLLKFLAIQLNRKMNLSVKMTDLAPKKFAATLGFTFCLAIVAFFLLGYLQLVFALTILLVLFALLESMLAICIGCYMYSFYQIFRGKNNKSSL